MRRLLILGSLAATLAVPAAPAPADNGASFRTCAEARAAGYSNIRRGSYGYGPHLDQDGDGIACES